MLPLLVRRGLAAHGTCTSCLRVVFNGPYRSCLKCRACFRRGITERSTYVLGVRRIPIPNPSVTHLVATVSADSVSFPLLLVISCVKFHYMVADGTKIMRAHTGIMLTNGECPTLFKSCSLGARACTTPKICCLSFYP